MGCSSASMFPLPSPVRTCSRHLEEDIISAPGRGGQEGRGGGEEGGGGGESGGTSPEVALAAGGTGTKAGGEDTGAVQEA